MIAHTTHKIANDSREETVVAFLLDFIISAYPHKILKSTLFGLKKT